MIPSKAMMLAMPMERSRSDRRAASSFVSGKPKEIAESDRPISMMMGNARSRAMAHKQRAGKKLINDL